VHENDTTSYNSSIGDRAKFVFLFYRWVSIRTPACFGELTISRRTPACFGEFLFRVEGKPNSTTQINRVLLTNSWRPFRTTLTGQLWLSSFIDTPCWSV